MIGADIGQDAIKMAVLSGRRLKHAAVGFLSTDEGDGPADLLRRMAQEADCAREQVWGSIQGAPVIVRVTTFPTMDDDQLRSAAALEAEELVSRDWSEMDFDCDVLNHGEDESTVLFVAAPRDLSDSLSECFRSAGLRCVGMTTCSLALVEAFRNTAPQQGNGKGALLLNIGSATTNLVLLDGLAPVVFRDIPFGTSSLGSLANGTGAAQVSPDGGASESPDRASLPRALEPLCDQVSRTLAYRRRRTRVASDLTVYLSGGGSLVPMLREELSSWLDVPVAFLDPFVGLGMECDVPAEPQERSCFAVSVGTALMGEEQA